ncbi:MAG TPA: response regulator, partial [Burkholderiales bacterium]
MPESLDRPEQDAESQLRMRYRGARVLLAEGDPINREVALDFLVAAGMSVDIVEDGQAAVERALGERYDLILMDLRMPGMDGLAATRAIRARPELAELPILATTADAFDEDRDACLAAGMNDLVATPLDPPAFYGALLRHLGTPAGRSGDARRAAAPGTDPAESARSCTQRI